MVQSRKVGGYTRQARAGGAPFTEEPLSSMRRTIAKRLSEAKVCVCVVCLCLCVCVCEFVCMCCVCCVCVMCVGVAGLQATS